MACAFRLAQSSYALDTRAVVTIMRMQRWTRLPASPAGILGAIAHPRRPQALPVVDLAQILGLPAAERADPGWTKQLLIEIGRLACAIPVQTVDAVIPLARADAPTDADLAWVSGYLQLASGRVVTVIDADELVSRLDLVRFVRESQPIPSV